MGSVSKTMTGARCKLYIDNKLAGLFSSVSYGVSYDVQPVYTLGRYEAAEIVYTGMATVDVQASGFRVMSNGPYAIGSVPKLQDLLNHQDISLTIIDRQIASAEPGNVKSRVMNVTGVRPTGFTTASQSRNIQDLTVTFTGLIISDESGDQGDSSAPLYG